MRRFLGGDRLERLAEGQCVHVLLVSEVSSTFAAITSLLSSEDAAAFPIQIFKQLLLFFISRFILLKKKELTDNI